MNIEKLEKIIQSQTELFGEYLDITNQMISCEADFLPELTQTRGKLCTKIDVLEDKKKKLCEAEKNGDEILKIVKNSCDFEAVPKQYATLFYNGQKMQAVINKIRRLDEQVVERISDEIDKLEQKIKEVNNGPSAKASLYFENMGIKNETKNQLGKA